MAEPVRQNDLAAVRAEVARIAGRQALSGLRRAGPGARGISDLLHANRVQGLVPGAGVVCRADAFEGRARASYGFADRRVDGALSGRLGLGAGAVSASLYREVRDVGDVAVVSPLVNSLAAQEFGNDYGDYVRVSGGRLAWHGSFRTSVEWRLAAARERIASLTVHAAPASGTYRPNAALGGTGVDIVTLTVRRPSGGFAVRRDRFFDLSLEAGRLDGGGTYLRLAGAAHLLVPLGDTRLLARVQGGVASAELAPHRAFVLGGRGTLLGDDFREWGGRAAALTHLEWRVPAPFPSLPLGTYARMPGTITLAPYVAAGWTDQPVTGTPWRATPGVRVTAGLAFEWLGVFRIEAGYGVQSRRAHVAFDVTRDFWSIL